jgi:uncharacterized protein YdiU (UPF0061 family)
MAFLSFDNAFVRDMPGDPERGPETRQVHGALYSSVTPTPVAAPRLVALTGELAERVGLDPADPDLAQVLSGNRLLPGMQPFAANYGGHQFGTWAGQLGDGRAITLGEVVGEDGGRHELQLKGAGPTPYSRGADGRAVLRSSIREFLCSEAMHHLGVPTTRALSLVITGDMVVRDMFYDGHPRDEPGAIVCRVAPSFLRFGNFELPASRGDIGLLERLVDFCIARDFPALAGIEDLTERRASWFDEICAATATMVAQWMRVGFVHGVMNTDNMSILGLTIDYGPYGWIDDYDPDWTPNTTDAGRRRYRFGQQPAVAYWNLSRLAGALSPLFGDAVPLQVGLDRFVRAYEAADRVNVAGKLGLGQANDDDVALMARLQGWMQETSVDMTIFFRALMDLDPSAPDPAIFADAFYDEGLRASNMPTLVAWLADYAQRLGRDTLAPLERHERMRTHNPRYVMRNYLAQEAIDRASEGDFGGVHDLARVMSRPYEDQPGHEAFARRRPDWARSRAGCSMLSCSS